MDQATLKQLLHYNPETGAFTWLKRRQGVRKDLSAGFKMKNGYVGICINSQGYYAHRLAWIYVYGDLACDRTIDHINGGQLDNRIANLRAGTQGQNMQNQRRAHKKNTSAGVLGVSYDKSRGKYRASICVAGRTTYLGRFDTLDKAQASYVAAKRRIHEFGTL